MEILRPILHYSFHFLVPGLIAFVFYQRQWKKAWLLLISTMLVDLDHLFANPIFDPNRCSIHFHFLHTYWAMIIYFLMVFVAKLRIFGIGLLFHMLTDALDCWLRQFS